MRSRYDVRCNVRNIVVVACTQREQVKTLYQPGDGTDQAANRDALDKVSGDRAFTCPTIELNEAFDGAEIRTYFYYLTHRASNEVWPPWMGVIHGADVQVDLHVYYRYSLSISYMC